jgi:toxin ParE1/3/4
MRSKPQRLSLATLSERGHIVSELDDSTIREVYVFRYRLIYRVSSDEVRILALIHGRMDFAGRMRNE